jgi:Ca2+:H+ antiporter
MQRVKGLFGWTWVLLVAIPLAIGLEVAGAGDLPVFVASALGVIPTAALMGRATEELTAKSGPGIGGLLNVTFGNAPELIIALIALGSGLHEVVKASLVGSIIGNALLVLGASMLAGGLTAKNRNSEQKFDSTSASVQAGMLMLAVVALVMPATWALVSGAGLPLPADPLHVYSNEAQTITNVVSVLLIATYIVGLVFSLVTHRDLFNPEHKASLGGWSVKLSVLMLAIAGIAVAGMSELLVGSIETTAHDLGLTEFFLGAIVVAIVGNAAEHWVAIAVARKDQMDLAVNISIGSAAQIALFVAPVLALISLVVGPHPMALVFNGYELAALIAAVLITAQVASRGRSTWFEGFQLLAVYAVIAVTFFLV